MSSYGLFPQILNPTREIDNSSTIIDNIFTDNISNSIQSSVQWCTVVTTLNFQLTASEMFQFKTSMLNLTMLMINLMIFTLN